jgi:hypothetical protein
MKAERLLGRLNGFRGGVTEQKKKQSQKPYDLPSSFCGHSASPSSREIKKG